MNLPLIGRRPPGRLAPLVSESDLRAGTRSHPGSVGTSYVRVFSASPEVGRAVGTNKCRVVADLPCTRGPGPGQKCFPISSADPGKPGNQPRPCPVNVTEKR